jgi:mono/diheme cytochrome c family protein
MSWVKWGLAALLAGFLVIQLVPYGRNHDNPPVVAEPTWDSAQTRELAVRACFDCHSNETVWPWYSNVAPISWLVQRDVDEGREDLNYSEWNRPQEAGESAETVREGSMPPRSYLLTHPEARLTDAELATLAAGLAATARGETGDQGETEEEGEEEND